MKEVDEMKCPHVSRHLVSLLLLGLMVLLAVGSIDNGGGGSASPPAKPSATIDLHASVRFIGTQFVILNKDSFDWTNVKLKINSEAFSFSAGYVLRSQTIAAGETATVDAVQFAKSDGEKFNPLTHKPLNFSISCDTPTGKGFYFGSWK